MKTFNEYHNLTEETVSEPEPETVSVKIGTSTYQLELAETPDKQFLGLGGRTHIPRKTGMLFVMPREEIQEFCMRDCKCNMDIIYVNEDNKIVGLHTMLAERPKHRIETEYVYESRLKKYASDLPARYAIEIPAGDIARLGLKKHQSIDIPFEVNEQFNSFFRSLSLHPRYNTQPRNIASFDPSLAADLARARQPLNRQLGVGEIGNVTGTYVRGTPAERNRLATQAGIGVNSSTSVIEREAANSRLQNRVMGGASLMPGGVPRDRQGNEVANTIANREAEIRSRYVKPGESDRTSSTGQRFVSNERDLTGTMYRDTEKEAARFRREDERRAAEKEASSVDAQVSRFASASPEERAEMIRKANAEMGYSTPPRQTSSPSTRPTGSTTR